MALPWTKNILIWTILFGTHFLCLQTRAQSKKKTSARDHSAFVYGHQRKLPTTTQYFYSSSGLVQQREESESVDAGVNLGMYVQFFRGKPLSTTFHSFDPRLRFFCGLEIETKTTVEGPRNYSQSFSQKTIVSPKAVTDPLPKTQLSYDQVEFQCHSTQTLRSLSFQPVVGFNKHLDKDFRIFFAAKIPFSVFSGKTDIQSNVVYRQTDIQLLDTLNPALNAPISLSDAPNDYRNEISVPTGKLSESIQFYSLGLKLGAEISYFLYPQVELFFGGYAGIAIPFLGTVRYERTGDFEAPENGSLETLRKLGFIQTTNGTKWELNPNGLQLRPIPCGATPCTEEMVREAFVSASRITGSIPKNLSVKAIDGVAGSFSVGIRLIPWKLKRGSDDVMPGKPKRSQFRARD